MLASSAARVLVLAAAVLSARGARAAPAAAVKICGRQLSEIMSRVCRAYNGPAWDAPAVVERAGATRRRRHAGIADECCAVGCTWDQLSEYCSVSALTESPLQPADSHIIAGRSAQRPAAGARAAVAFSAPAAVGSEGHARGAGRARHRRCWCRRRRRARRRRPDRMGDTNLTKSVARAAPVVGTVSPLLTWGRTLNNELPVPTQQNYAYVIYT